MDRFSVDENDRFVVENIGRSIQLPARYKFVKPIGSGGGGLVMYNLLIAIDVLINLGFAKI